MSYFLIRIIAYVCFDIAMFSASKRRVEMKFNKLSSQEKEIIEEGGTEHPHSGRYVDVFENGIYICKKCNTPLFKSETKFQSHCGWPSFDLAIKDAILSLPDEDGVRTEIRCKACDGHLGHVFSGENYTELDTRYCVNSVSMNFVNAKNLEVAYFSGGCFWGVEYHFGSSSGVLETESGYMGGSVENPNYEDICTGKTNHAETVRVVFNNNLISFKEIATLFFEIHDPTQLNQQGVDIGTQYRSAVFYTTVEQKAIAQELVDELKAKSYNVVTEITAATTFWRAEEYHQKYFSDSNAVCHTRVKRF